MNRADVLDNIQSVICRNLCFKCRCPAHSHDTRLYQKRTDALRWEVAPEEYNEVSVHSSLLKEKEAMGQHAIH